MLDSSMLKDDLKAAIEDTIPNAVKSTLLETFPFKDDESKKLCEMIGDNLTKQIAGPLAERFASAIDAYVKCIEFKGTILTTGSPVAQQAVIFPGGMPTLNGAIPNTIGVM